MKSCPFSTELRDGVGDASPGVLGAGRGSKLWPWSISGGKKVQTRLSVHQHAADAPQGAAAVDVSGAGILLP